MASIPLPALHIQPPADPSEGFQRAIQLRELMQRQQLFPGQIQAQQQQLASGAADLQLKQQQVVNQQAGVKAMQEWDGKNINDLPSIYAKHGADANTVIGLKNNIIKQQQDLANLDKDTLSNMKSRTDLVLGAFDSAKNVPDEQLGQHLTSTVQDLTQRGLLNPQSAQAASALVQGLQNGQLDAPTARRQLDVYEKSQMGLSQLQEQALKSAQTTEATAKGEEAGAQAKKITAEINPANPADVNLARQKYQGILQTIQTQGIGAVPTADLQWAKAHEAAETKRTTQSDTLGVTSSNISGPAGLATVGAGKGARPAAPVATPAETTSTPSGTAAPSTGGAAAPPGAKQGIVDAIGQYKYSPQLLTRLVVKHPDILSQVSQAYPEFSQANYNAINHMVTSYTSGPESKSINAISTAMGHGLELGKAIDALGNGDTGLKFLRNLGNQLDIQTGGDAITTFNLIARRLAPEITAAYVQGGGGEGERVANAGDFDASLGGKQLRSNLAKTIQLLGSKIAAQEQQWNTTVQPTTQANQFRERFLTPLAKQAIAKYGSAGGGATASGFQVGQKVTLKNGNTVTIKTVHPDGSFDAQ